MKLPTLLFAASLICAAPFVSAQDAVPLANDDATDVDSSALHGVWQADLAGMLDGVEMSDEERAMAVSFMEGAALQIQFTADGQVEMRGLMMGQHQVERGTWRPMSSQGSVLTIENVMADGPDAEAEVLLITFSSATAMSATDPAGETIPFTKLEAFTVSDVPPPADPQDLFPAVAEEEVEYVMPADWPDDSSPEAGADWIEGTWNTRFDVLLADEALHPAERRELARFFTDARMEMTFEPGGVFRIQSALLDDSRDDVGTWTLTEASGSLVRVTVVTFVGTPEEETQNLVVQFLTRDAATIGDTDAEGVPCTRAE